MFSSQGVEKIDTLSERLRGDHMISSTNSRESCCLVQAFFTTIFPSSTSTRT